MQKKETNKDVIIACDFKNMHQLQDFLDLFPKEEKPFLKIGMQLFYSVGPDVVKKVKNLGHRVFLDLKVCDTPTTVFNTMRELRDLSVDLTNVHAFGGIEMMESAIKGLSYESGWRQTKLIAVTMLTSIKEATMHEELLIDEEMNPVVMHYAHNAKTAGLDGVVCSVHEAEGVHTVCGNNFLAVTPDIQFANGKQLPGQQRVATPSYAKDMNSDFIVVGRAITEAPNPVEAYQRAVQEFH